MVSIPLDGNHPRCTENSTIIIRPIQNTGVAKASIANSEIRLSRRLLTFREAMTPSQPPNVTATSSPLAMRSRVAGRRPRISCSTLWLCRKE